MRLRRWGEEKGVDMEERGRRAARSGGMRRAAARCGGEKQGVCLSMNSFSGFGCAVLLGFFSAVFVFQTMGALPTQIHAI
jgi:hypothetical protein